MADESLKDFTINWMLGGLLMFCILAFSISFVYNNNPDALNDGTWDKIETANADYSSKLYESQEDSNTLLNVTSNTNPEVSDLGSRDSVAVSFGAKGTATSYWESSKTLISWVFSGTSGKILLGSFGAMISFLAMFFIWRFIKSGG